VRQSQTSANAQHLTARLHHHLVTRATAVRLARAAAARYANHVDHVEFRDTVKVDTAVLLVTAAGLTEPGPT
jgi:hypothetical protein